MINKNILPIKDIINCKGKRKLAEVYTHNPLEAEACELAGIEMIVSSEKNDISGIRNAAKNTFLTVGLQYGKYLTEYDILKRSFVLFENGADAIYCPQSNKYIKAIADEGIPVVGHTGFIPYKSTFYGGFKAFGKNSKEAKIAIFTIPVSISEFTIRVDIISKAKNVRVNLKSFPPCSSVLSHDKRSASIAPLFSSIM